MRLLRGRRRACGLPVTRLPAVPDGKRAGEKLWWVGRVESARSISVYDRSEWKMGQRDTHRVLLDSVGDALDNVVDDGFVVPVGLVIAEAHHAPVLEVGVPMDFDDTVVELVIGRLHPKQRYATN